MCANCKKSYLRESHLQVHVRSHLPTADRPLACAKIGCSKRFWMMQHPKVHVVSMHRVEKVFCVSWKLFRKVISRESQQPMGRSVLNRCTGVQTPSQKTTMIRTANRLYCLGARTALVGSVQSGAVRLFVVRCGVLNQTSSITRDDHALLRQAYKGLARRIKNEMVHHNRPVTLRDLCKLVQTIDHRYWEWKAKVTHEANPTSRVDPRNDPKTGKNPEAMPKGKSLENLKPGLDLVGKLGKDRKLTPQERQHHMDNSLCLFCGKTGHIAKECPKSTAIAARACAAITELQESFIKEAKKD